MVLTNLEGVNKKDVECEIFGTTKQMIDILNKGLAATTADNNGAINAYKDDDGFLRGELMRYCRTIDKVCCKSKSVLKAAVSEWLKQIR